jgi:hypothetical protein
VTAAPGKPPGAFRRGGERSGGPNYCTTFQPKRGHLFGEGHIGYRATTTLSEMLDLVIPWIKQQVEYGNI